MFRCFLRSSIDCTTRSIAQQDCALLRIFANQHAECAKRAGYQPVFNFADPFSFTGNENSLHSSRLKVLVKFDVQKQLEMVS